MTTTPEVRVRPHETRAGSLVHRARSADGVAVSVRTTDGRVDYVRVGAGRWGGWIGHDEAATLANLLGQAIRGGEDAATRPGVRYRFGDRTDAGTSVSVRLDGPVHRYPEFIAGGIDYIHVGSGAWGGSIGHEAAVALHAALLAALAGGEPR